MKFYFSLQFQLLNRQIKDFGLSPLTAYLILIPLFVILSFFVLLKHPYIPYAYGAVAFLLTSRLAEHSRNTFLKYCFTTRTYYLIRLIETQLITLPFALFLLIHQYYYIAVAIHIMAALSIFLNIKNALHFTIPTPFFKYPFEFTTGFRSTFYVFLFTYFTAYMGLQVGNYNLCIASLLLIYLTTLTFYFVPEGEYYVWIYANNARSFLLNKTKIALLFSNLLSLPVIIGTSVCFPEYTLFTLTAIFLGCMYLCLIIIAKYQSYPHPIGLPYMLSIGLSILFPPIALGLIFIYYPNSIKRLQQYLK